MGVLFLVTGSLLVVLLTGCSGDSPLEGGEEVVARLIADDPQELLAAGELFDSEAVFSWDLDSTEALDGWHSVRFEATQRGKRWRLRPSGEDPQLIREVDLESAELHALEVVVAGLKKGELELYWAGPGELFSADRRLAREPPRKQRGQRTTLTFDLASRPGWRGRVERLRFDPTSTEDVIEVFAIRGLRRSVNRERLATAAARGWKVDLGADVRNALLTVPDLPVEHQPAISAGQLLRFSYGVEEGVTDPVTFLVTATRATANRVPASREAGEPEVLFEETVDRDSGSWHEASIDLTGFAGERPRLQLAVRSAGELDLARGFPVWGNPEILGPAEGETLPNVVLISIDTLRADHLSAYGYPRATSPNIDAWAAGSAALFENAVAQAPWTLPSHVSMFTGLDALRHGVNHTGSAPPAWR